MACALGARVTPEQCRALRKSNKECFYCRASLERTVLLDIPISHYSFFAKAAKTEDATIEELLLELCAAVATGKVKVVEVER